MRLIPIRKPKVGFHTDYTTTEESIPFIDIDKPYIPPFFPNDIEIFGK